MPHRFLDTFQIVQATDGGHNIRRIRPLRAAYFNPAPRFARRQECVQKPLGGFMGEQTFPKIMEESEVKPGSCKSRLSTYFQSIQRRTASAAWRSVSPSIYCMTITSAKRQGATSTSRPVGA
jgi:hypothetical protein